MNHDDNPMAGFMPMPYQMMMPWQRPQEPKRPDYYNEVPARVVCAMEFLDAMTRKQMARPIVAASSMGVEVEIIPGMKWTEIEAQTHNHALFMLQKYFAGDLEPSDWEQMQEEEEKQTVIGPQTGEPILINCPACLGREGLACRVCDGKGRIVVKRH